METLCTLEDYANGNSIPLNTRAWSVFKIPLTLHSCPEKCVTGIKSGMSRPKMASVLFQL